MSVPTDTAETLSQQVDIESKSKIVASIAVIKRNGKRSDFDSSRIRAAIQNAMAEVLGKDNQYASASIHEKAAQYTSLVIDKIATNHNAIGSVDVEKIQEYVERVLMMAEEYEVLRTFILYREEHKQLRGGSVEDEGHTVNIKVNDKQTYKLTETKIRKVIEAAAHGLEHLEIDTVVKETFRSLYDGVSQDDYYRALIMSARALVEKELNHTYLAARLVTLHLKQQVSKVLGAKLSHSHLTDQQEYSRSLKDFINYGIQDKRINPELAKFDLKKLGQAIDPSRDASFTYLSVQNLYDRYFTHYKGLRYELPQVFFMRVAMGLALVEKPEEREQWAIEFYNVLSTQHALSSTPTLFNSGTTHSQLSSCFLTTVEDDLDSIFHLYKQNALMSKWAGGLGNDWTPIRASGSHIKGTNGNSLGIIPFLNVADASNLAVNQGGKRNGAMCAYLETWHMDVERFLELRKNTGDDRMRTHDMNTAMWVPDLFMQRLHEKGTWTLFTPNEVPDLHDLFGDEFEAAYVKYEAQAEAGEIMSKTVNALDMWRKMLGMLFETGHPWITFKDPCNARSPQQHVGRVHSSNLCTEITLNTSKDEIAVCNLASVNLVKHMTDKGLDKEKLRKTVRTVVRMLDNVIDQNFYAVPEAKNSNLKHRPVGMGLMGFQDALYLQRIPYASDDAVEFADRSMEYLSYCALEASSDLAAERGTYPSYEGSLWSQGILPIDSIELLAKSRGEAYLSQDRSQTLDWNSLRSKIKKQGMRNSNVLAIAPTATIANIASVSASIEPTYQNLYVKSNLSGEFTIVNPYLVEDLKKLGMWDAAMVNDLKYYDGSVQKIDRIPEDLKALYSTVFEVEPEWLIKAASRRQKWIDQSQSLNLYFSNPKGKVLDRIYRMAWQLGLKTTYYCRSLGATTPEKSTLHEGKLNAVKACNIDDPDCEACQ